jgi:exodeoxyribonuclease V alpha subunit
MDIELQGQLERITYYNEDNHYTIAKIKVQGRRDLVTIVGSLVSVSPGEMLRVKGIWDIHPKYGEQFRISSYETIVPATVKGIERYLGSGLIKGIGPVMAKRLVSIFGTETLDIIENNTDRLREVGGIGEKRAGMIRQAWSDQKEIREVMLFLQGHEVGPGYAAKIYKHYGKNSIAVVKGNPYRLADEIFGIGFRTADSIARKLGMPFDSPARAEAGILYVLRQLADEGHVYFPRTELTVKAAEVLEIDTVIIIAAFGHLSQEKKIVIENDAVYLTEFFTAETSTARSLKALFGSQKVFIIIDREKSLADAQLELKVTLADSQRIAITESLEKKVLVITGGPGTGKTTIIRAVIAVNLKLGQRIMLAAPTGRAAKRMEEATGHEAKTIHRLLEFSPRDGRFKRDRENPLEADFIVIDEASMIDIMLMHQFMKAVPEKATLVLVGDIDQLPSVGAGSVLKDIIESDCFTTVRLSEIFRQSGESSIILNAHRVNHGEFPILSSSREVPQDFYFIELEEPEEVCKKIICMCAERIPAKFGYHEINDIQVLSPMHRGSVGTSNLNNELQKRLNPSTDELVRGGKVLKAGDKVMQIRNNYDKDIFNGDIGKIIVIDREEQTVSVDYDGRQVSYDFQELDEIVLAYAISVHKSQGSEYPVVVIPLLTQHYMMLQRNLLYTAITRGKKLVVIIGTKKAIAIAVKNNTPQARYTRLSKRLIDAD